MFKVELSLDIVYTNIRLENLPEIIFISSGKVKKYPLTYTCKKGKLINMKFSRVANQHTRVKKKALTTFSLGEENEESETWNEKQFRNGKETKGEKWIIGTAVTWSLCCLLADDDCHLERNDFLVVQEERKKKTINIYIAFSWPIFYF